MADIGGKRNPGDEGTTTGGGIATPMCPENIGRGGNATPPTHEYKGMPSASDSTVIEGPGQKNKM